VTVFDGRRTNTRDISLGSYFTSSRLFVLPTSALSALPTSSAVQRDGSRLAAVIGVRAYSVTTGVWLRAALVEDFGLNSSKVTWVVDDEEHVLELELPPNVSHTENGRSLADMMADGELSWLPALRATREWGVAAHRPTVAGR
jgi:hypothetical protein